VGARDRSRRALQLRRRPPALSGFEEPYVLATVETAEGVRLNTSIVGASADELEIGMPLEVMFEAVSEDVVVPKFKPVT
jgi:uncharacterized OB-fold protein